MSYRIVVCGGRTFGERPRNLADPRYSERCAHAESERTQLNYVLSAFHDAFGIGELAHGGARGADTLAGEWAARFQVPCRVFTADWKGYGNLAGALRNKAMLEEFAPDYVIVFPGGKGTADCVRRAKQRFIPVLYALMPWEHELRAEERIPA